MNPKGTKKSRTSRKGKEAAGVSGQVETDGANPTVLLPIQTDGTNVGTGLPIAQLNPTEVPCGWSWTPAGTGAGTR